MKIAVIGLGFVGMTTALGFAHKGFTVFSFDNDKKKSDEIRKGNIPFYEKNLSDILESVFAKTFFVMPTMKDAVSEADVVFFCVGTPCNDEGEANLEYLKSAVRDAVKYAPDNCVMVIKSTVPPGTTENIIAPLVDRKSIAMNPEFLREGYAWDDFIHPDRIVIGVSDERSSEVLKKIYEPFCSPLFFVTIRTAEFIKYLSNTLLANLISFSNEMAGLAEKIEEIDIADAFRILCEDKRLKGAGISSYIYPGCGYGGSCLPKDTTALLSLSKKIGYTMPILNSVIETNLNRPVFIVQKIISKINSKNDNIGILGLSFKPNSDDVRYSPSSVIIDKLVKQGYKNIYAYDPMANENFAKSNDFDNVMYCKTADDVCRKCEVVAIVTTWNEFSKINKKYTNVNFIDCRYFLCD